jgi:hypothetical protein
MKFKTNSSLSLDWYEAVDSDWQNFENADLLNQLMMDDGVVSDDRLIICKHYEELRSNQTSSN